MRSIARQSACLARSSRVRQPSRPRRPPAQQHVRSFCRTVQRPVDTRGPNGDHEPSIPAEQRQDDQKSQAEDAARVAKQNETKSVEEEGNKSGVAKTRRTRIQNAKEQKPPKPPPIPDWFLNHNVKLLIEPVKPKFEAKSAQVLRCVDRETGHTLFVVPYYEAWPVPGLPGRLADEHKQDNEAARKKSLDNSFFDNKFTSAQSKPTAPKARTSTIITPPSEEAYNEVNPHSLLRWALLEAETGLRAGFTVPAQVPSASLNAASRVDISLHCPDSDSHEQMDDIVEDLGNLTQADIIRLDANDFADLTADYVGGGEDLPGSFSSLGYDVFDGYTANQGYRRLAEEDEFDEDEEDENDEEDDMHRDNVGGRPRTLDDLRRALSARRFDLAKAFQKINVTAIPIGVSPETSIRHASNNSGNPFRAMPSSDGGDYDRRRLRDLLDQLLEAPKLKNASPASYVDGLNNRLAHASAGRGSKQGMAPSDRSYQALWRPWRSSPGCWYPDVASVLAGRVHGVVTEKDSASSLKLEADAKHFRQGLSLSDGPRRTIVHVRDLKDICSSHKGDSIVRDLVRVVQKRRRSGQEIVIVGTTAQDVGGGRFGSYEASMDEFRTVTVPPYFNMSKEEISQLQMEDSIKTSGNVPTYRRILEINLRHIQSMLQRLRPGDSIDLFSAQSQNQLRLAGSDLLSQTVLPFDQVQRLVLTAVGLSQTHAQSDVVNASHIGLAVFIAGRADRAQRSWSNHNKQQSTIADATDFKWEHSSNVEAEKGNGKVEKLRKSCNQYETKLLPGVVDPQNIKVGFNEVHAPPETIDALKTLTSLSLLRPDAFKYGVLSADRLPGLMLYGPPGTGKTLLAKAVAKESRATVLEISGAQIYEKYVGEGEKMVKAVFSLAKKLSPCIVFIDEADAIFGSRSSAGNRNTHREIINQFLREWDGMDLHNVFIMVASNRPFDMDDAVLRRLPRRLLVDLPVARDREAILKIHLKEEQLDGTVDLGKLAEETPLHSGSDLKNLCVAAALACVRDENELAATKQDDQTFKLPDRRTLSSSHFEKAAKEISASISEDMSSLTAIRKFDEQYGDRRGRRKKSSYGFGSSDVAVDENAARVRQPTIPSPTPTTTTPPPP